jgi:hypothetical protein
MTAGEKVRSWLVSPFRPRRLLVRYEDHTGRCVLISRSLTALSSSTGSQDTG